MRLAALAVAALLSVPLLAGCHRHAKSVDREADSADMVDGTGHAKRASREERQQMAAAARERAARMVEADDYMVRGCQFLGSVKGTSGWGGRYGSEKGMANAMQEAIENAARKGATHYVRGESHSGGGGSSAYVRAYACAAAAEASAEVAAPSAPPTPPPPPPASPQQQ